MTAAASHAVKLDQPPVSTSNRAGGAACRRCCDGALPRAAFPNYLAPAIPRSESLRPCRSCLCPGPSSGPGHEVRVFSSKKRSRAQILWLDSCGVQIGRIVPVRRMAGPASRRRQVRGPEWDLDQLLQVIPRIADRARTRRQVREGSRTAPSIMNSSAPITKAVRSTKSNSRGASSVAATRPGLCPVACKAVPNSDLY
ncbi:hypothetical protein ABIB66_008335 [Bradyrhizobium sp. F1.13.3]